MISSVTDYHYVTGANVDEDHPHGDMDRILIDGDIMPLREGELSPTTGVDRSRILRGEDICFLMEGFAERLNWWKSVTIGDGDPKINTSYPSSKYVFYRRLDKIESLTRAVGMCCYLRSISEDGVQVGLLDSQPETNIYDGVKLWENHVSSIRIHKSDFETPSTTNMWWGGDFRLRRDRIRSLFKDLSLIKWSFQEFSVKAPFGFAWTKKKEYTREQGADHPQEEEHPHYACTYISRQGWNENGQPYVYDYYECANPSGNALSIVPGDVVPDCVYWFFTVYASWSNTLSGETGSKTYIVNVPDTTRPDLSFFQLLAHNIGFTFPQLPLPTEESPQINFATIHISIDEIVGVAKYSDHTQLTSS